MVTASPLSATRPEPCGHELEFSAWSIRNPMPPVLLFIVLMALGVMSFMKLPVTRFPNIDIPIVAVTVGNPGVAPAS